MSRFVNILAALAVAAMFILVGCSSEQPVKSNPNTDTTTQTVTEWRYTSVPGTPYVFAIDKVIYDASIKPAFKAGELDKIAAIIDGVPSSSKQHCAPNSLFTEKLGCDTVIDGVVLASKANGEFATAQQGLVIGDRRCLAQTGECGPVGATPCNDLRFGFEESPGVPLEDDRVLCSHQIDEFGTCWTSLIPSDCSNVGEDLMCVTINEFPFGSCAPTPNCASDNDCPDDGDGLNCTIGFCNEVGQCDWRPITSAELDDGIDCTIDVCNPDTGIAHVPHDNACDDGAWCNGSEICSPGTTGSDPQTGCMLNVNPPRCEQQEASSVCMVNQCDEDIDDCVEVPDQEAIGNDCNDENSCTVGNVCDEAGQCTAGQTRVCENTGDGLCTIAVCDPTAVFNDACSLQVMDDGTPCGETDGLCLDGSCQLNVCTARVIGESYLYCDTEGEAGPDQLLSFFECQVQPGNQWGLIVKRDECGLVNGTAQCYSTYGCVDGACEDDADCGSDEVCYGGSCMTDTDTDGIPDTADNCPLVGNGGQADTDGDGTGNACDSDFCDPACGTNEVCINRTCTTVEGCASDEECGNPFSVQCISGTCYPRDGQLACPNRFGVTLFESERVRLFNNIGQTTENQVRPAGEYLFELNTCGAAVGNNAQEVRPLGSCNTFDNRSVPFCRQAEGDHPWGCAHDAQCMDPIPCTDNTPCLGMDVCSAGFCVDPSDVP